MKWLKILKKFMRILTQTGVRKSWISSVENGHRLVRMDEEPPWTAPPPHAGTMGRVNGGSRSMNVGEEVKPTHFWISEQFSIINIKLFYLNLNYLKFIYFIAVD